MPTRRTCRHLAYRMTCEQYQSLLSDGGQRCRTCQSAARLVIDHDHRHGPWAVRGLICQGCNAQLRPDRPAPEWAVSYLATPWYQGELTRLGLTTACPVEPEFGSVRSFDGKTWHQTLDGSWTHGFKGARCLSWHRLFYEFGPWGLVIP